MRARDVLTITRFAPTPFQKYDVPVVGPALREGAVNLIDFEECDVPVLGHPLLEGSGTRGRDQPTATRPVATPLDELNLIDSDTYNCERCGASACINDAQRKATQAGRAPSRALTCIPSSKSPPRQRSSTAWTRRPVTIQRLMCKRSILVGAPSTPP